MGRNRFVVPKTVQLQLSGGDWIEVKERLTVGEARAVTQSFVGTINGDGSRTLNEQNLGLGLVLAYLVDWSFDDANGKRVPVSREAVKALDMESFREIDEAIDAHIERIDAEDGKKKTAPGETAPSATS
jgi:hypothetical protein